MKKKLLAGAGIALLALMAASIGGGMYLIDYALRPDRPERSVREAIAETCKDYPAITPHRVTPGMAGSWTPYTRDPENGARYWAVPGTPGFSHRIGGLEKSSATGAISTVLRGTAKKISTVVRVRRTSTCCLMYSYGTE